MKKLILIAVFMIKRCSVLFNFNRETIIITDFSGPSYIINCAYDGTSGRKKDEKNNQRSMYLKIYILRIENFMVSFHSQHQITITISSTK